MGNYVTVDDLKRRIGIHVPRLEMQPKPHPSWEELPADVRTLLRTLFDVAPKNPHLVFWDNHQDAMQRWRSFVRVHLPDMGWDPARAERALARAVELHLAVRPNVNGGPLWWEGTGLVWGDWVYLTALGDKLVRRALKAQRRGAMIKPRTLLERCQRLRRLIDAATTPAENGRRVRDGVDAAALSQAADDLYAAVARAYEHIVSNAGVATGPPQGVSVMESASPDGPFAPVPASAIRSWGVPIGRTGASPLLVAALRRLMESAGFSIERWNAMQAERPGDDHLRYRTGDVIPREHLDELANAEALLALEEESNPGWDASGEVSAGGEIVKAVYLPGPKAAPAAPALVPPQGTASEHTLSSLQRERKRPAWERLQITRSDTGDDLARLDGKDHRLTGATDATFLEQLRNKEGKPILGSTLEGLCGERPSRIYRRLPGPIQRIIDKPGLRTGKKGYRML